MKIPIFLIFTIGIEVAYSQAISDLTAVLNHVIGAMNSDKFFETAWEQYFVGIVPILIPNNCNEMGAKIIDRANADDSLSSVLDRGSLRIGIHESSGSIPSLYSIVNGTDSPTTDLSTGPYDGYEAACAKAAVQLLGAIYGVDLVAEFIVIGGDYFEVLRDALNDGTVDVVWSSMTVNDQRALEVDFTCPSFATEYVIAASPEVGSIAPKSTDPAIPVACAAIFCNLTFPPPFVPVEIDEARYSLDGLKGVLTNPNDEFNYTVLNFEDLRLFFRESCENCSIVNINSLSSSYQAPCTKILNTSSTNRCPDELEDEECLEDTTSASSKSNAALLFAALFHSFFMLL